MKGDVSKPAARSRYYDAMTRDETWNRTAAAAMVDVALTRPFTAEAYRPGLPSVTLPKGTVVAVSPNPAGHRSVACFHPDALAAGFSMVLIPAAALR